MSSEGLQEWGGWENRAIEQAGTQDYCGSCLLGGLLQGESYFAVVQGLSFVCSSTPFFWNPHPKLPHNHLVLVYQLSKRLPTEAPESPSYWRLLSLGPESQSASAGLVEKPLRGLFLASEDEWE